MSYCWQLFFPSRNVLTINVAVMTQFAYPDENDLQLLRGQH